mmetsp:Transcript_22392/g.58370  ORF Transcript_22392/g.58370 Transcript_22392/m.58370 type:complete len:92 (-) Transcript_22392:1781-2056(-)
MDQGLRLGMSSAATVHTFFAGLPERFYFLRRFEEWADGQTEIREDGGGGGGRRRSRADLKALKGLENCDSPLSPELNDMQLHHPFSKLCPT